MSHSQSPRDYDYVVVGAGSAGCVIARRLTEDPSTSVLVLEAGGPDNHYSMNVPAAMIRIKPEFDWNYKAQPDASRDGMEDFWSSGRVFGGGSSINAMVWARGNHADYDNWAKLGCDGWDFDSVLPYFRRAEQWEGGEDHYRGASGPQTVSRTRITHKLIPAFVSAAHEAGLPINNDYNGAEQEGVATGQVSQRRGLRASAYRSYLKPVRRRKNLTLQGRSHVTRIVIENGRAVGVEYVKDGRLELVRARREVLLCAGAIASPKLLMLSGIGPAEHLRAHGIGVVADVGGVGQNLMEHPHATLKYEMTESTLNTDLNPLGMAKHGLDFLFRRRGAVTSGFNHAIVFARSDGAPWPDIEMQYLVLGVSAAVGEYADEYGLGHEVHSMTPDKYPAVTVLPAFLHPKGRGRIALRSANAFADPIIDHELIGDPHDMAGLLNGVKLAREIFRQPAISKYVVKERIPGGELQTDDELRGYLRAASFTGKHASGTCKMGVDDDAVVDPELRVRGIEGLRVIDASIMPVVTSSNTNAPTIMIAERAADLVRFGGVTTGAASVSPGNEAQATPQSQPKAGQATTPSTMG